MSSHDLRSLRDLVPHLRIAAGGKGSARAQLDPTRTYGLASKQSGEDALTVAIGCLEELQPKLAAQDTYSLLVVVQGMDAAGKDSLIKHTMSGLNPQGVVVHSFKEPSQDELAHDFLWRYEQALPRRGMIGIFNRSHYEEVLVVRVHPANLDKQRLPDAVRTDVWQRRYQVINEWERYLVENGIKVVKLFLNVSYEEQRKRFLERLDNPEKTWKFSVADIAERRYWDQYQRAYEEVLQHTSSEWAPWHVIPADHKWYAHVAAIAVILDALEQLRPHYPAVTALTPREIAKARAQLRAERPS